MREGVSQLGQRLLTATEKIWRVGKGRSIYFFSCSGCKASTIFRNLQ